MQLIANKTRPCGYANGIGPLAVAAVPIWIDREVQVAHAWTIVIRGVVKLTGPINWTNCAWPRSLSMGGRDPRVASPDRGGARHRPGRGAVARGKPRSGPMSAGARRTRLRRAGND